MGQLEVRARKLARSVLPSEGRKTRTGLTHAESVGAHNHLIYLIVGASLRVCPTATAIGKDGSIAVAVGLMLRLQYSYYYD